MIVTKYPYTLEGVERYDLCFTYSNTGLKIIQTETNIIYENALDIYPSKFIYQEYIENNN